MDLKEAAADAAHRMILARMYAHLARSSPEPVAWLGEERRRLVEILSSGVLQTDPPQFSDALVHLAAREVETVIQQAANQLLLAASGRPRA